MESPSPSLCYGDPNFAIISGFFDKFGKMCGITFPSVTDLASWLVSEDPVPQDLIVLQCQLLRKLRRSVTTDRFEKYVVKFIEHYSPEDAVEFVKLGYGKCSLKVKIRLLKELLDCQFDSNPKFKAAVNLLTAEELRPKPVGKDLQGRLYWSQFDTSGHLRVYREDPLVEDNNWKVVADDRQSLVKLLQELTGDDSLDLSPTVDEPVDAKGTPVLDTGQNTEEDETGDEEAVALSDGAVQQSEDTEENTESILAKRQEVVAVEKKAEAEDDETTDFDDDNDDDEMEVSEAIEEPLMLVEGEGSGAECDAVSFFEPTAEPRMLEEAEVQFGDILEETPFECSEEIEEDVMFFYGAGLGAECDTGNPDRGQEKADSTSQVVTLAEAQSSSSDIAAQPPVDSTAVVDSTTLHSTGGESEVVSTSSEPISPRREMVHSSESTDCDVSSSRRSVSESESREVQPLADNLVQPEIEDRVDEEVPVTSSPTPVEHVPLVAEPGECSSSVQPEAQIRIETEELASSPDNAPESSISKENNRISTLTIPDIIVTPTTPTCLEMTHSPSDSSSSKDDQKLPEEPEADAGGVDEKVDEVLDSNIAQAKDEESKRIVDQSNEKETDLQKEVIKSEECDELIIDSKPKIDDKNTQVQGHDEQSTSSIDKLESVSKTVKKEIQLTDDKSVSNFVEKSECSDINASVANENVIFNDKVQNDVALLSNEKEEIKLDTANYSKSKKSLIPVSSNKLEEETSCGKTDELINTEKSNEADVEEDLMTKEKLPKENAAEMLKSDTSVNEIPGSFDARKPDTIVINDEEDISEEEPIESNLVLTTVGEQCKAKEDQTEINAEKTISKQIDAEEYVEKTAKQAVEINVEEANSASQKIHDLGKKVGQVAEESQKMPDTKVENVVNEERKADKNLETVEIPDLKNPELEDVDENIKKKQDTEIILGKVNETVRKESDVEERLASDMEPADIISRDEITVGKAVPNNPDVVKSVEAAVQKKCDLEKDTAEVEKIATKKDDFEKIGAPSGKSEKILPDVKLNVGKLDTIVPKKCSVDEIIDKLETSAVKNIEMTHSKVHDVEKSMVNVEATVSEKPEVEKIIQGVEITALKEQDVKKNAGEIEKTETKAKVDKILDVGKVGTALHINTENRFEDGKATVQEDLEVEKNLEDIETTVPMKSDAEKVIEEVILQDLSIEKNVGQVKATIPKKFDVGKNAEKVVQKDLPIEINVEATISKKSDVEMNAEKVVQKDLPIEINVGEVEATIPKKSDMNVEISVQKDLSIEMNLGEAETPAPKKDNVEKNVGEIKKGIHLKSNVGKDLADATVKINPSEEKNIETIIPNVLGAETIAGVVEKTVDLKPGAEKSEETVQMSSDADKNVDYVKEVVKEEQGAEKDVKTIDQKKVDTGKNVEEIVNAVENKFIVEKSADNVETKVEEDPDVEKIVDKVDISDQKESEVGETADDKSIAQEKAGVEKAIEENKTMDEVVKIDNSKTLKSKKKTEKASNKLKVESKTPVKSKNQKKVITKKSDAEQNKNSSLENDSQVVLNEKESLSGTEDKDDKVPNESIDERTAVEEPPCVKVEAYVCGTSEKEPKKLDEPAAGKEAQPKLSKKSNAGKKTVALSETENKGDKEPNESIEEKTAVEEPPKISKKSNAGKKTVVQTKQNVSNLKKEELKTENSTKGKGVVSAQAKKRKPVPPAERKSLRTRSRSSEEQKPVEESAVPEVPETAGEEDPLLEAGQDVDPLAISEKPTDTKTTKQSKKKKVPPAKSKNTKAAVVAEPEKDEEKTEESDAEKEPENTKVTEENVGKTPSKKPRTNQITDRELKLLGLTADTIVEESSGRSLRASRRIAQNRIKEDADRHKMENEQKKKEDSKGGKNKKKKNKEEYEVPKMDVPKKMRLKFTDKNPWLHSSGSSCDEEADEEEIEEEPEPEPDRALKSDHEFSPESDLEDDDPEYQPMQQARTARIRRSSEQAQDDYTNTACEACSKSDRPEEILLCDDCDNGWHIDCVKPPLHLVPDGQWFCPPCGLNSLITGLKLTLRQYDRFEKQRDNEELRKKRLAFVGISLDNVLPPSKKKKVSGGGRRKDSASESESAESSSESKSSGSSDSEPIYQLRERRSNVASYRYNEYDDMIRSAIQEEMEEAGLSMPQRAAKPNEEEEEDNADADAPPSVNGESKKEKVAKEDEEEKDNYSDSTECDDEEPELLDEPPPVVPRNRKAAKKKKPKLTSLEFSSEEDRNSDSDFKGASTEAEESEEASGSDSSGRWTGRKKRRAPIRRSERARRRRYDKDFINDDTSNDDDDDEGSKKWKSSGSDSDKSWGGRTKRNRRSRVPSLSPPRKKKRKHKKKKREEEDDDKPKSKKRRIKYGLDSDSDEKVLNRRTRGKQINYVVDNAASGSDEDEEKVAANKRKRRKIDSDESDDEFKADDEEKVEDEEEEEEEPNEESESSEEEPVRKKVVPKTKATPVSRQSIKKRKVDDSEEDDEEAEEEDESDIDEDDLEDLDDDEEEKLLGLLEKGDIPVKELKAAVKKAKEEKKRQKSPEPSPTEESPKKRNAKVKITPTRAELEAAKAANQPEKQEGGLLLKSLQKTPIKEAAAPIQLRPLGPQGVPAPPNLQQPPLRPTTINQFNASGPDPMQQMRMLGSQQSPGKPMPGRYPFPPSQGKPMPMGSRPPGSPQQGPGAFRQGSPQRMGLHPGMQQAPYPPNMQHHRQPYPGQGYPQGFPQGPPGQGYPPGQGPPAFPQSGPTGYPQGQLRPQGPPGYSQGPSSNQGAPGQPPGPGFPQGQPYPGQAGYPQGAPGQHFPQGPPGQPQPQGPPGQSHPQAQGFPQGQGPPSSQGGQPHPQAPGFPQGPQGPGFPPGQGPPSNQGAPGQPYVPSGPPGHAQGPAPIQGTGGQPYPQALGQNHPQGPGFQQGPPLNQGPPSQPHPPSGQSQPETPHPQGNAYPQGASMQAHPLGYPQNQGPPPGSQAPGGYPGPLRFPTNQGPPVPGSPGYGSPVRPPGHIQSSGQLQTHLQGTPPGPNVPPPSSQTPGNVQTPPRQGSPLVQPSPGNPQGTPPSQETTPGQAFSNYSPPVESAKQRRKPGPKPGSKNRKKTEEEIAAAAAAKGRPRPKKGEEVAIATVQAPTLFPEVVAPEGGSVITRMLNSPQGARPVNEGNNNSRPGFPGQPIFHSAHPMDPSPSGGGAVAVAKPSFPPSEGFPPYQNFQQFPAFPPATPPFNEGSAFPPKQQTPAEPSFNEVSSGFPPKQPSPPAPPTAKAPLQREAGDDETSGEFGGLASYFASQAEEDI